MDPTFKQSPLRTNVLATRTSKASRNASVPEMAYDPRSPWGPIEHAAVRPLRAIYTLGEQQAVRLERVGITDTRLLWAEDVASIATIAGVSRETADDWRCMCELLAIPELQPSHVASLVTAGVTSIEGLCVEDPVLLLLRLRRHQERHGDPSRRQETILADVRDWIAAANRHKGWTPRLVPGSAAMEA